MSGIWDDMKGESIHLRLRDQGVCVCVCRCGDCFKKNVIRLEKIVPPSPNVHRTESSDNANGITDHHVPRELAESRCVGRKVSGSLYTDDTKLYL